MARKIPITATIIDNSSFFIFLVLNKYTKEKLGFQGKNVGVFNGLFYPFICRFELSNAPDDTTLSILESIYRRVSSISW